MGENSKISAWIENRLAKGTYSFTLEKLKVELPQKTEISISRSLSRLVKQEKIISIYTGFYIIIPPSYRNMGSLPPIMFTDDLMNFLERPYYVSLLSAAAIFGAGHQQPQTHYVSTTLPAIRSTKKKGVSIQYISKRNFSDKYIVQIKTETGYVNVSNPILTCIDLIKYHKTIGGLNRAATIISELSEEITAKDIEKEIFDATSNADLQRLGYIWEHEVNQESLANYLFDIFDKQLFKKRTYKLLNSKPKNKTRAKNRWKINVNTLIEIDE